MQIHPGPGSPTKTGMDPEIAAWDIFDGGKTLVLLDLNSQNVDLAYPVQADGYGPVLDPIIKNGGGTFPPPPPPPSPSPPSSGVDIGLAAAVLVALVVGYFARYLTAK